MSGSVAVFNSQQVLLGYVSVVHAIQRICQGRAWALQSDPTHPVCFPDFCLLLPLAIATHGHTLIPVSKRRVRGPIPDAKHPTHIWVPTKAEMRQHRERRARRLRAKNSQIPVALAT